MTDPTTIIGIIGLFMICSMIFETLMLGDDP